MNSASDSSVRRMMVAKGGRRGREGMMMMDRNEVVIGPISEAVYEGKFFAGGGGGGAAAQPIRNGQPSRRSTHSLTALAAEPLAPPSAESNTRYRA